ncbi:MAG: hypothetical protein U1E45_12380 [Geminicoccaceae bacterium]
MSRDVDRKLCLTAAALGVMSRKRLAAAFHRVNPATSFDLERAHKWIQGRAKPRDPALYEDWARVLDLGQPGAWVAACTLDEFVAALCERGPLGRDELFARAGQFGGMGAPPAERPPETAGRYVCYSHAWSPYFRGRLIRGLLTIRAAAGGRLQGCYEEGLPTGPLRAEGEVTIAPRAMHLDLRGSNGVHFVHCLFPPSAPCSVLGGLMMGSTVIGPEGEPSATRIVMIRINAEDLPWAVGESYLVAGASIAAELVRLGFLLEDPEQIDRALAVFLQSGSGGGFDQIPADTFRALVGLFDQLWFGRSRESQVAAA